MNPFESFEKQSQSLNLNCRHRFKVDPPTPPSQFQFYQKISHVKLELKDQPKMYKNVLTEITDFNILC